MVANKILICAGLGLFMLWNSVVANGVKCPVYQNLIEGVGCGVCSKNQFYNSINKTCYNCSKGYCNPPNMTFRTCSPCGKTDYNEDNNGTLTTTMLPTTTIPPSKTSVQSNFTVDSNVSDSTNQNHVGLIIGVIVGFAFVIVVVIVIVICLNKKKLSICIRDWVCRNDKVTLDSDGEVTENDPITSPNDSLESVV
uniref:Uncharacterized LOC100179179 n=1 Tax=Ciona intestinalis TaxID=7719 RepID=F7BEN3_CIOIN|nr:uncharacterized protein LOC100179179 [Ciona intestinalis]|eukprot:XP_002128566.1 uncharacterized protein LOC100179179 [Ciona intestinalis]